MINTSDCTPASLLSSAPSGLEATSENPSEVRTFPPPAESDLSTEEPATAAAPNPQPRYSPESRDVPRRRPHPGMSSRGSGGRTNGSLPQTKICQFKLVLLGDMAVGKSSLVLRFVKGQFDEFQETTIGAAFLAQSVCLDDTTVKFEIWDTAGQERYHSLAPMYYRGAQAAIVVFDITKPDTFERAKAWVKELQRQASPNIVIALAGNKADLAEKRLVEYEEAQTYADDTGLLFMETSAKTAMNVNELFLAIAKKMPKTDTQNPTHAARHRGVNLQDPDAHSTRACCGGN
ncbi:unnamed protein product [Pleuronectes platessa]|uniref:Rab5 n=2 Tax=Pleuronectes platessa TaxID=8262 RepID=A0A9N7TZ70_PLEPL|nr:unnamed protein product [Pleuronectes platessa]